MVDEAAAVLPLPGIQGYRAAKAAVVAGEALLGEGVDAHECGAAGERLGVGLQVGHAQRPFMALRQYTVLFVARVAKRFAAGKAAEKVGLAAKGRYGLRVDVVASGAGEQALAGQGKVEGHMNGARLDVDWVHIGVLRHGRVAAVTGGGSHVCAYGLAVGAHLVTQGTLACGKAVGRTSGQHEQNPAQRKKKPTKQPSHERSLKA